MRRRELVGPGELAVERGIDVSADSGDVWGAGTGATGRTIHYVPQGSRGVIKVGNVLGPVRHKHTTGRRKPLVEP
jgi:hypothetical protein